MSFEELAALGVNFEKHEVFILSIDKLTSEADEEGAADGWDLSGSDFTTESLVSFTTESLVSLFTFRFASDLAFFSALILACRASIRTTKLSTS